MGNSKTCARCHTQKDPGEFSRQSRRPDGLHVWCKSCCLDYNREHARRPGSRDRRLEWRRINEAYDRVARVAYLYGLSATEYERMLDAQGRCCAICRTDTPGGRWNTWHVDHDHRHCPGKRGCAECVRGLLCNRCNTALGYLDDDPERLIAALSYLLGTSAPACVTFGSYPGISTVPSPNSQEDHHGPDHRVREQA